MAKSSSDTCEIWAARELSHRPHVRRGCFQTIVHSDVSLLRNLDARFLEPDAACIRRAPKRHQNVAPRQSLCVIPGLELNAHTPEEIALSIMAQIVAERNQAG